MKKEEMKNELKKMLEEMKNDLDKRGKYNTEELTKNTASNLITALEILHSVNEGKSIIEASNEFIRSYDEALALCLKAGANDDEPFRYDFTTYYINTLLSLVANLISIKDFAKDPKNRAFLKSKIRESLIYIDML